MRTASRLTYIALSLYYLCGMREFRQSAGTPADRELIPCSTAPGGWRVFARFMHFRNGLTTLKTAGAHASMRCCPLGL